MPILFSCTNCDKQLRVADEKAGRKVKCPICSDILVVPDAEEEPLAVVPKRSVVTAKRPKAAAPEQDFEVVEDDPPARKHDFEVVEDDPPPRKRSRKPVDEDEDDRPARDEGAEAPARRPKRKKKPKKSGSGKGVLLVVLLLGVGLLLLGGGGFAVWYFAFSSDLSTEMKYLPDGCQSINSSRVDKVLASQFYQEMKKEAPDFARDDVQFNGLSGDDILRVTNGYAQNNNVKIFTTKRALSADDVKAKSKVSNWTEEKVNNYTLYTSGQYSGFCVPESKVILFGTPDALRKVLQRDKKPTLSEGMKKALKLVNFSKADVTAVDLQSATSGFGVGLFTPLGLGQSKGEAEAMGSHTDFGSEISTSVVVLCKDAKAAEEVKRKIEEEQNKTKTSGLAAEEMAEQLKNQKISVSGAKVTITNSVKVETVVGQLRKARERFGKVGPPP